MNKEEYLNIKDFSYEKYCDYLQKKYGVPQGSYFLTPTCKSKNQKITRGKEGLFIHHIKENVTIMLCNPKYAIKQPFEYQKPNNLVYCNYLEHLLLHIMIVEESYEFSGLGIGGIENFLVPELNDLYSGWKPKQEWKQNAFNLISNLKDVYLELINRYFLILKSKTNISKENYIELILTSFNEEYGLWNIKNNNNLFLDIKIFLKNNNLEVKGNYTYIYLKINRGSLGSHHLIGKPNDIYTYFENFGYGSWDDINNYFFIEEKKFSEIMINDLNLNIFIDNVKLPKIPKKYQNFKYEIIKNIKHTWYVSKFPTIKIQSKTSIPNFKNEAELQTFFNTINPDEYFNFKIEYETKKYHFLPKSLKLLETNFNQSILNFEKNAKWKIQYEINSMIQEKYKRINRSNLKKSMLTKINEDFVTKNNCLKLEFDGTIEFQKLYNRVLNVLKQYKED